MRNQMTVAICLISALTVRAGAPNTDTRALMDSTGARAAFDGDRLTALFGKPLASNTASDPMDDFVDDFVTTTSTKFGVSNPTLVFDKKDNCTSSFTVYTYTQEIESLPVFSSVLKLKVLHGSPDKITYAGIRLFEPPATALPADVITAAQAETEVSTSDDYDHLTNFSTAEKVVFVSENGKMYRAWSLSGSEGMEAYLFMVDTNSGEIITAIDLFVEAGVDVSGTVAGYISPCCGSPAGTPNEKLCPSTVGTCPADPTCDAEDDCETADQEEGCCCAAFNPSNICTPDPVSIPLSSIRVQAFPGEACSMIDENDTPIDTVFTDENGDYVFSDIDEAVTIVSHLVGGAEPDQDLLVLSNCGGIQTIPCTEATLVACDESLSTAAPSTNVVLNDLVFAPPTASAFEDLEIAQVNGLAYAQATRDWMGDLNASFASTDTQVDIAVNLDINCGAEFVAALQLNNLNPIILFAHADPPPGPTCENNTAISTLIAHEYGHYIQFTFNGLPPNEPDFKAFREGYADTVFSLSLNTPCLAGDLRIENGDFCSRQVDTADRILGEGVGSHEQGLALAGAFWDTRKRLIDRFEEPPAASNPELSAKRVIDQLFSDFSCLMIGELNQNTLIEVLIADDDDGDFLGNGSPNDDEILASFVGTGVDQHGWMTPVCASDHLHVEWDGPSGDPVEGIDYEVDCSLFPPNIKLISTEKGGDFVVAWRIGRSDGGNIGNITTDWVGTAANIVVEIGTLSGFPVRDLDGIDIDAESATTHSSIVLDLTGDLKVDAKCNPDSNGNGGRISGTIAGDAGRIEAEAIGQGILAGDLDIDGRLRSASLAKHVSGSKLICGTLTEDVVILDDSDGNITIDKIDGGSITVNGDYSGLMKITAVEISDPGMAGEKEPKIQVDSLSGSIAVLGGSFLVGSIEVGTETVSGDVSSTGLIRSDSKLSGEIVVHGDVAGTIDLNNQLGGTLTITGDLSGDVESDSVGVSGVIDIDGDQSGDIDVLGDVLSGADISVFGTSSGNITVTGDVADVIDLGGDLSGDVTFGSLTGTGGLVVSGSASGTVEITGDTAQSSLIHVDGGVLDDGGEILVQGDHDGEIRIDEGMEALALIHVGGLEANGVIDINNKSAAVIIEGDIRVEPAGPIVTDVVFDGQINIFNGPPPETKWLGRLEVVGCHNTTDDLDICIEPTNLGRISISQPGCSNTVTYSCVTP